MADSAWRRASYQKRIQEAQALLAAVDAGEQAGVWDAYDALVTALHKVPEEHRRAVALDVGNQWRTLYDGRRGRAGEDHQRQVIG